ncbi:hypothetical protein RF11_03992 [Thelohanellus kitauei]|uniref:Reverse transcriptase domain-containing protein n=1 Tax=Thelohanellus kitauei TaxID=669202 RepID=A0A0C2MGD8_THEKT|nr:hypothetical protein RF11_03992 [Thelohanellus kitauei]
MVDNQIEINFKKNEIAIRNQIITLLNLGQPGQVKIDKENLCKTSQNKTEDDDLVTVITNGTIEAHRKNNPELGTIPSSEHKISLKDPCNNNQSKSYAIPHLMQPKVKEEIERLCALGIRESASPFSISAFCILKEPGIFDW